MHMEIMKFNTSIALTTPQTLLKYQGRTFDSRGKCTRGKIATTVTPSTETVLFPYNVILGNIDKALLLTETRNAINVTYALVATLMNATGFDWDKEGSKNFMVCVMF